MFVSNVFGIVKKAAIVIETISKVTEVSNDTICISGQEVKMQKHEKEDFLFSGFKNNHAYKIIYALWKKEKLSSEVLKSHSEEDMDGSDKGSEIKQLEEGSIEVNIFNPQIVDT